MEPVATLTYADAMASGKQFDVLWVPAGAVDASTIPKEEIAFIAQQAPKAKYVMSVCGGAVQLAFAGRPCGKTSNDQQGVLSSNSGGNSQGYPVGTEGSMGRRWNVWTSSGVAAGSDMALAFVEHLAGREVARFIRGGIEIPEVTEQDDPFATFHGLV
ncbi:class I glutamine amidotransferase-like protein [Mycena belliarum]|uniref:Class I glutamine amidotransferase-like protein n=1 Tax=Mycena belliarum TaxID=1033014 RepID=A0AAD6TR39_9AGAR|nr:class I glutamine amidotransferase-like protein [Mycena belliae]